MDINVFRIVSNAREQVGGESLAGVIINVSFQMIQENRDGILIRILRLGSFSSTHTGRRS